VHPEMPGPITPRRPGESGALPRSSRRRARWGRGEGDGILRRRPGRQARRGIAAVEQAGPEARDPRPRKVGVRPRPPRRRNGRLRPAVETGSGQRGSGPAQSSGPRRIAQAVRRSRPGAAASQGGVKSLGSTTPISRAIPTPLTA
jgi:hypothetical protein